MKTFRPWFCILVCCISLSGAVAAPPSQVATGARVPEVISLKQLTTKVNEASSSHQLSAVSEAEVTSMLLTGIAAHGVLPEGWSGQLRTFLIELTANGRLTLPVDVEEVDQGDGYPFVTSSGEEFILSGPRRTEILLRVYQPPTGDMLYWIDIPIRIKIHEVNKGK